MRKLLYIVYQPYKWLFFYPFLVINTLLFSLIAVVFSMLFGHKTGSYWGGAVWSRVNAFFTPMIVRTAGKHHIDPTTSYVIVPNHQSYWDIFLLYGWLGIDIKWIMKKELRKIPGLGYASATVGHIFIDRSNTRKALESLNQARKRLTNGTSVVIFPEGTRSKTGNMLPFKRGAFKMAVDLNLKLLPVTIIGTNKILPPKSMNLMPGKVKMIVHEPIDIKNYGESTIKDLMQQTKEVIETGM
jgi:1-acyl-sn-glycerol-3-phosphate acyltransferase